MSWGEKLTSVSGTSLKRNCRVKRSSGSFLMSQPQMFVRDAREFLRSSRHPNQKSTAELVCFFIRASCQDKASLEGKGSTDFFLHAHSFHAPLRTLYWLWNAFYKWCPPAGWQDAETAQRHASTGKNMKRSRWKWVLLWYLDRASPGSPPQEALRECPARTRPQGRSRTRWNDSARRKRSLAVPVQTAAPTEGDANKWTDGGVHQC